MGLTSSPLRPTASLSNGLCLEWDDGDSVAVIQALEAFVSKSPHETQPLVSSLFDQVLKCLSYDPNFTDDMEDDEEDEDDEDNDGYASTTVIQRLKFSSSLGIELPGHPVPNQP